MKAANAKQEAKAKAAAQQKQQQARHAEALADTAYLEKQEKIMREREKMTPEQQSALTEAAKAELKGKHAQPTQGEETAYFKYANREGNRQYFRDLAEKELPQQNHSYPTDSTLKSIQAEIKHCRPAIASFFTMEEITLLDIIATNSAITTDDANAIYRLLMAKDNLGGCGNIPRPAHSQGIRAIAKLAYHCHRDILGDNRATFIYQTATAHLFSNPRYRKEPAS